jgi:hypothetical protein
VQPGAALSATSVTDTTPGGLQPAIGPGVGYDATVHVDPAAATGPRDLTITNPDTTQVLCGGCIDVEQRPATRPTCP